MQLTHAIAALYQLSLRRWTDLQVRVMLLLFFMALLGCARSERINGEELERAAKVSAHKETGVASSAMNSLDDGQSKRAEDTLLEEARVEFAVAARQPCVTFAPTKADLSVDARFALERQALWLRSNGEVAVRVSGYAGASESKSPQDLAIARARVVRDYLVEFDVRAQAITVSGAVATTSIDVQNKICPPTAGTAITSLLTLSDDR